MSTFPSTSESSESNPEMQELNGLMPCLSLTPHSKAGDSPPVSSQPRRRVFKIRPEKPKPQNRSKEELHQIYGRFIYHSSDKSSTPFRGVEPSREGPGPSPSTLPKGSKEPKKWIPAEREKIENPDLQNKLDNSYSLLDWSLSSSERSKCPDLPKDLFSKVIFVDEGLLRHDKYSLLHRGGASECPESDPDEESTDELEGPAGPRAPSPPYVPFPARKVQTVPEVLKPLNKAVDWEDHLKGKSKLEPLEQRDFEKDVDSKSKGRTPDLELVPKRPGEVGLSNVGNTCFINAGLQCLLNTPALITWFVGKQAERKVKERRDSTGIVESLQNVFSSYWNPNPKKAGIDMQDFVKVMRGVHKVFDDSGQHDCHEFLLVLLNTLDDNVLKASRSVQSRVSQIINKCFKFVMQNVVSCCNCKSVKEKLEDFYFVPLSFPPASEEDPDVKSVSRPAKESYGMEELLEYFIQNENLDSENYPECSECEQKQAAAKKQAFFSLPNYLIIHLKRFAYVDGRITKLRHPVKFPIWTALDMRTVRNGNSIFKLYGCVCHSGGVSGGHYTAYAKNSQTSEWHFFNDESVICQEPDEGVFTSAYILFYAKTDA